MALDVVGISTAFPTPLSFILKVGSPAKPSILTLNTSEKKKNNPISPIYTPEFLHDSGMYVWQIRTYKSRFKNGLGTFPHYSTCENFWRKKDVQTSIVRED